MCRRNLRVRAEESGRWIACTHCGHRELTALARTGDGAGGPCSPRPPEIHEGVETVELDAGSSQERARWLDGDLLKVRKEIAARHTEHAAAVRQLREAPQQLPELRGRMQVLPDELEQAQEQRRSTETARQELESERAERDQLPIQIESPRRRVHEAERLLEERRAFEDEVESSRSAPGELERSLEERSSELDEMRRRWRAKRREMQAQWDQERHDLLNDAERLLGEVRERLKVELQGWHDRLTTARGQFDRDLENLRGEVDRISRDAEDSLQEEAPVLEPAEVISHEHEPSAPCLEAPPVSSRNEEPSHHVEVKRSARVTAEGQWVEGRAPSWREEPEDFERLDAPRSAPQRRIPFILMLLGGLTVAILCLMPYLLLPMQWSTYAVSTTLGLLGVLIFSLIEARLIGANPLRYALQAALVGGVIVALFLLVSRHLMHSS